MGEQAPTPRSPPLSGRPMRMAACLEFWKDRETSCLKDTNGFLPRTQATRYCLASGMEPLRQCIRQLISMPNGLSYPFHHSEIEWQSLSKARVNQGPAAGSEVAVKVIELEECPDILAYLGPIVPSALSVFSCFSRPLPPSLRPSLARSLSLSLCVSLSLCFSLSLSRSLSLSLSLSLSVSFPVSGKVQAPRAKICGFEPGRDPARAANDEASRPGRLSSPYRCLRWAASALAHSRMCRHENVIAYHVPCLTPVSFCCLCSVVPLGAAPVSPRWHSRPKDRCG